MTGVVLGLDVGGTKAHGALVGPARTVHVEAKKSTVGRDPGLRATADLVTTLTLEAAARGLRITAVGAGFPEYVSPAGLLTSTEVLDWTTQPGDLLRELVPGVPVVVDSDVRCGALGELRRGAGGADFFYVSLGSGLSSVQVSGGALRYGRRGEAIGLGEFVVPSDIDDDWRGSLEDYASGSGVAARYARATGSEVPDGTRSVAARAAAGDDVARLILDTAGRAIGAALAQVVAVLDPHAVILGGGLGTAETELQAALRAELDWRTARRPDPPRLSVSELGPAAGLHGAVELALDSVVDEKAVP